MKAKGKGRGKKAATADVKEEEVPEKGETTVKPKRGKKKGDEVVEIAETQDIYMEDVVESASGVGKMGLLAERRKEQLRLEQMRKNEAEERLEEFVRNSEAIQSGMFGKKMEGWRG